MTEVESLEYTEKFKAPSPVDREVSWDKSETIMSKTDLYGTIEYANDAFVSVSGYSEHELVGKPHNLIRHPDMPKVIFKVLWDSIKKGYKFHGIVKNLAKSGEYYWVITDFDYIIDDDANILKYIARRKAVPDGVVKKIEKLYNKLLKIEEVGGVEASEKYLTGFLEEQCLTYVQYVTKLMVDDENEQEVIRQHEIDYQNMEKEQMRKNFFQKFFGL